MAMKTEVEDTYTVVRKYKDINHEDHDKTIESDLTRKEAQKHCSSPESKEDGVFFDCFYKD